MIKYDLKFILGFTFIMIFIIFVIFELDSQAKRNENVEEVKIYEELSSLC